MTNEAIGFVHSTSVPWTSIVGIPHTEGGIVAIEDWVIARNFIAKFSGLFVVIEVSFAIIFTKPPSWMAGPAILDDEERGFVNFREVSINLLSQLARISRGQSMFSVHSGGEVPWKFGIEGIAHNNLPASIRSALLEMVTIGDSIIIVAGPTGLLRTVRHFTIDRERGPIKSL